MYQLEEFRDSLERILVILGSIELRFALTGGAAAVAFGEPRMTQDIDIVVDREQLLAGLPTFLAAIPRDRFMADDETIRRAAKRKDQFQLFDYKMGLKFDFYPNELVEGELGRSVNLEIAGIRLPVISRPDAIVSKLIWIEMGSHRSRRDLRQMMQRATDEEITTVRKLAEQKSLTSLLEEVLAEPDEIRP